MRICFERFVFLAMPLSFSPVPALTALLVLSSPAAHGEVPAQLPAGDSDAFRARMMDWSQPAAPLHRISSASSLAPARAEHVSQAGSAALPRLTSRFGYRFDPIRGDRRMHSGIDIPGALGTPVRASASGIVRFAGRAGGYGNMIEIDHGNGLETRYGHLSQILVGPGTMIGQGQVLGLMGSTGRSTGSHLHFEVRSDGHPADPLAYLTGGPASSIAAARPSAYAPGPMDPAPSHISAFAKRRAQAQAAKSASQ